MHVFNILNEVDEYVCTNAYTYLHMNVHTLEGSGGNGNSLMQEDYNEQMLQTESSREENKNTDMLKPSERRQKEWASLYGWPSDPESGAGTVMIPPLSVVSWSGNNISHLHEYMQAHTNRKTDTHAASTQKEWDTTHFTVVICMFFHRSDGRLSVYLPVCQLVCVVLTVCRLCRL